MPDQELVTLTINGQEVQAPKGVNVVEAAKLAGIEIPVFCYHPKLRSVGACRMCLVEVEKMRGPQTACTTTIAEGMVVSTESALARSSQKGVLEFLLANHPLDCPICDKGGECPLQDNTFRFGLGTSRFLEIKRKSDKALPLSERIVLERERCIMCYRCVRFHDEIVGDQAIAAMDRGGTSIIGVLDGETYDSPFSGNTVDICPVGALLSRQYRFQARPWDLNRTPSVCTGCAVGCNVLLDSRGHHLLWMVPRENMAINNEWLCDYGRFDTAAAVHAERLTTASVNGETVGWPAAMAAAVEALRGQVEVVASPSITNEALTALRTIAGQLGAPLSVWPKVKTGRVRGAITDLVGSKTIILLDFDVWTKLPVLALRVREALKAGASLYFVGNGPNGLLRDTARAVASAEELPQASALAGPISILGQGADDLAQRLEATGMVGEPATAANGWAMADLREAGFEAPVQLLVGNEPWPETGGQTAIQLRWGIPNSEFRVPNSIYLPIAHPYEQTGTVTNVDGHVQELRAGARPPAGVRADWAVVTELAQALGIDMAGATEERQTALA